MGVGCDWSTSRRDPSKSSPRVGVLWSCRMEQLASYLTPLSSSNPPPIPFSILNFLLSSVSPSIFPPLARSSQVKRASSDHLHPREAQAPLPQARALPGGYDRQRLGALIPTRLIHTLHNARLPSVTDSASEPFGTDQSYLNLHTQESINYEFLHRHVLRRYGEARYSPTSSLPISGHKYLPKLQCMALYSQLP